MQSAGMSSALLSALALCLTPLLNVQDATAKAAGFQWKLLPGYTLESLTTGKGSDENLTDLSTAGLSWPDGRQAVVTTFRLNALSGKEKKTFLYRCIDYYTARMEWNGHACYEARTST
jgi:hypothetical protein